MAEAETASMLLALTVPQSSPNLNPISTSDGLHRSTQQSPNSHSNHPPDQSRISQNSQNSRGDRGSQDSRANRASIPTVGGKAASLAKLSSTPTLAQHVPKSLALTVEFFRPWIELVERSDAFQEFSEFTTLHSSLSSKGASSKEISRSAKKLSEICSSIKQICRTLPLNPDQSLALQTLVEQFSPNDEPSKTHENKKDQRENEHVQSDKSTAKDDENDEDQQQIKLLAVRSSAPEEDSSTHSFAGMFETKLGVERTYDAIECAVRDCFASKYDERVLSYVLASEGAGTAGNVGAGVGVGERSAGVEIKVGAEDGLKKLRNDAANNHNTSSGGFAAVIMEMIPSQIAGVAFSANPLNSDRDELVIDSSWGLGESIVDGTVQADRFVFDKVGKKVLDQTLGKKTREKRLKNSKNLQGSKSMETEGCVETLEITDEKRQNKSSLNDEQLHQLAYLVCQVEEVHGVPMDVEFAFANCAHGTDDTSGQLKLYLLQARPITTLFQLDANMMTEPHERRILYLDLNIATEATTTTPFTTMDMEFSSEVRRIMMCGVENNGCVNSGCLANEGKIKKEKWKMFRSDPNLPAFNASTRQYCNLSIMFKIVSPKKLGEQAQVLDPYLASLYLSKDCNRKRYKAKKLPKGVNLRNAWFVSQQIRFWDIFKEGRKFKANPLKAVDNYLRQLGEDMQELKLLEERGLIREKGLQIFFDELCICIIKSFFLELACTLVAVVPLSRHLDQLRREAKTPQIRQEYDALCQGFEGDDVMEINIGIQKLASKLPERIWAEYGHGELDSLASRIQSNLDGSIANDLPEEFLLEWKKFMEMYGYDGQDQIFVSSSRYVDTPELLLGMLKQNVGSEVMNTEEIHKQHAQKRREVMALQEQRAKKKRIYNPLALRRIKKRNEYLDHLMWIRNSPKLHLAKICFILRTAVLQVEEEFLNQRRLMTKGDIFHLNFAEVDRALLDDSFDLMNIVNQRKPIYESAMRATVCPMMVDSRCRILQPDPPIKGGKGLPEGTLVGAPVSPGIALGKVRILHSPSEYFEHGEVLAATVTGPAWTPLFVSASAVILQIGGVLQHGALCAREFGKPAVSNIDVHSLLKTGMLVTVDGNTGAVTIKESEADIRA